MHLTWLKEVAEDSPFLLRAYGRVLLWRARAASARGAEARALHWLLRAHRIVPERLLPRDADAALQGLLERLRLVGPDPGPITGNEVLAAFVASAEADRLRSRFGSYPVAHRVRLRAPRDPDDPERQGNLLVLKERDPATGEKGVLLVKYTPAMRSLAAVFDLPRLLQDYMIVLEPSSWGYQDLTFFFYVGAGADVVVQSPRLADYEFLGSLDNGMVPVRVGAGDWVDPSRFVPGPPERRFAVAMISMWDPLKRHDVLFGAMRTLREKGVEAPAALVGYPGRWTRERVEALAREAGVLDLCTFRERIPHSQVAQILGESAAYVLLSRREGANKSLYESMFCDTPVIVPAQHVGVNLDHVREETGVTFASDDELPGRLVHVLEHRSAFRPREWAMENTGADFSTELLNRTLRRRARDTGQPWTRDIVVKINAPHLRYRDVATRERFDPEYVRLEAYLRR